MALGKRHSVAEEVGPVIRAIVISLISILVGCVTGPTHIHPRPIQSNAGHWLVDYTPRAEKIPLNTLFEVRTRIYGDGEIKSLQVDAGMPSHGHGMMTKAVTVLQEDGSYLTTGMLLHMPGEWEIYFDIDNGKVVERAQDTITLEP